jgi:hypothetical protein
VPASAHTPAATTPSKHHRDKNPENSKNPEKAVAVPSSAPVPPAKEPLQNPENVKIPENAKIPDKRPKGNTPLPNGTDIKGRWILHDRLGHGAFGMCSVTIR